MKVLIAGGAGFVGTNLALYLHDKGYEVTIFDNLSRGTAQKNIKYIEAKYPDIKKIIGDVRNFDEVSKAVENQEAVFNLAAQVAVTTSLISPREDFEINILGSFNLLEAVRKTKIPLIYTSTNKVYGDNVNNIPIEELEKTYDFANELKGKGIPESFSVDAKEHTPYGCSKLAADKYTQDYYYIYGVPTVVNRMSCIYGLHQFGTEDQGWLAHFIISALKKDHLTIFGDGKQVRDVLFAGDLVRLLHSELENIDKVKGETFNVGGGPNNTISLLQLLEKIKQLGSETSISYSNWREADQKVYYSDISKAKELLGWEPQVNSEDGIEKFYEWAKNLE